MKIQPKLLFPAVLVVILSFLFSGCATIVSRTNYQLHINSDPKGAEVIVTDRKGREVFTGKSPTTITVRSGAGYFTPAKYYVKLTMTGYEEKTIPVTFTINGWYFGNIFLGGALGMLIVDPATGAMWKIKDPVVDETLKALPASTKATLKILNIHDIPGNLKSNLVKLTSS